MNESQRKLIELIKASVFSEASLKPQAFSLKNDESDYGSSALRDFGTNEPLSPNPSHLSPELLILAKKHSVLPIIQADYEAVSKSDNQLYAADEMQSYFEQHGIYNCALKGINTKRRYPKPELRPMSDLDLLYKPEQTKQLRAAMKELGYKFDSEERRHDSFTRQPYICVEMHRIMAEPGPYYDYYKDPWSRFVLKPNCQYTYEMRLEDEFIYCIVHAAEHFKLGGVGIRVILDFAVYKSQNMDWEYFYAEIDKLGLRKFYLELGNIAENWFLGGHRQTSKKLEKFILESGLYGTEENTNAARVGDSKAKFITSALFPSYESMCSVYPWLSSNKVLLPVAWVKRWIKAFLFRRKNVFLQLKRVRSTNSTYKDLDEIINITKI